MGMTIAEKIIAAAAGVDSVKPGDIYTVQLDHLMSNDGTTHLTVDMYNNKLKNPHIADTKKLVFIVDHNVPSDSPKTAASQKKMRDFARENNIDFWEGKGVCHQIMIENYVRPGQLIFGADARSPPQAAVPRPSDCATSAPGYRRNIAPASVCRHLSYARTIASTVGSSMKSEPLSLPPHPSGYRGVRWYNCSF